MTDAVILMTALLPTTGHRDLVQFALNLDVENVWVYIQSRSSEPTDAYERFHAIKTSVHPMDFNRVYYAHSSDDDAPQNPEDHPDFWNYWADKVRANVTTSADIILVGSEGYGVPLAAALGCEFVPYDIARQVNPIKGEHVRDNILNGWEYILPNMRRALSLNATMFGQESVGKTTIADSVACSHDVLFLPEYAREYLETVGSDLTQQKMNRIASGQMALQSTAYDMSVTPMIVQDTDLFSTIGYCRIGGYDLPDGIVGYANASKSDIYFLLPDDVPFEPNELRYGGDVRESSYQFWKDILDEYHLPYVEVPPGTLRDKVIFVSNYIYDLFQLKTDPIERFVRE